MNHSISKLHLKTSLVSLLQFSKTTSKILQVHAQLITTNLISDPFVASRLLASITSSNAPNVGYAELVFTQIDQPNTFIYNTLIKCYSQCSNPLKALSFYVGMRRKVVWGDNYTYPFVLKACRTMAGLLEGREVHGEIVKRGYGGDVFVVNGLIGMYFRCGEIGCARMVLDGFEEKDLVSWNLVLGGYVGCRDMEKAQKVFDEMPEKDVVSWSIMIDGYGKKIGDVVRARNLFDTMPARDLVSWNSMIDGYAKVGELVAARQLFDDMPEKNVISWSIMIGGYTRHGNPMEALNLFRHMLCQGMKPDMVSVVGAISACAQLGALDQGRWLHLYMKKNQIMMDIVVQTALVDMYMKCGSLDEANRVFYSMSKRNVVVYGVMIAGLGMNGLGQEALECFIQMEREGIPIDDLIFLGVLTACSHAGLVAEGLKIFDRIKRLHRLEPKLEHYGCLVDLLGRAGQLKQALNVVKSMPMQPNYALWGSILLACRISQDVAVAEVVVEKLVELRADDAGVYVLLSNIYADVGSWVGAQKMRKLMINRKMKKEIGRSIIELDGSVQEFVSGEQPCNRSEEIRLDICSLLKIPILQEVL